MSLFEALILGVIQGATEFLPVSSSGHLVLAQRLLGIEIQGVLFEVVVHVGTLLSVVLVYWERLAKLIRGAVSMNRDAWRYIGLLAVATIPATVVGLLWKDRIEALFDDPAVPGYALLVTGLILITAKWAVHQGDREEPTTPSAFAIGVAQAFALIPGISRSGSTVVTALWLKLNAEDAAAFAFLMAIPAIAGAAVLQIPDIGAAGPTLGIAPLFVGGIASAVTGVLAIRTFVALLARKSFHWFAPYCWAVGSVYLAWLYLA